MAQALAQENRSGTFPADAYWQDVLGVELSRVDASLAEREALQGWLERQSDELLALLEEGAGLASGGRTKRERAARLLEREAGIAAVRKALICRHYLVNRRKEALHYALDSVVAARPFLARLNGARGDWLRVALEVAAGAPECLPWFDLWDRALRVGYREYRLTGAVEPGDLDKERVDRAIRRGFDAASLRCVDVVPHPGGAENLVFLLHETGTTTRILTRDGVRHVERVDWIILRLADGGRRLWAHSRGDLGVRLAEAIVAEAAGAGGVVYRPYLPQTAAERVVRWAQALARQEGEEVRLYEVDLVLPQAPQTTWSIRGDVVAGLEWMGPVSAGGVTIGGGPGARPVSQGGESNATRAGAAAVLGAGRLMRLRLGFREDRSRRWSRFTLWMRPGDDESAVIVSYRGQGVSAEERRSFLAWMSQHGIECTPV